MAKYLALVFYEECQQIEFMGREMYRLGPEGDFTPGEIKQAKQCGCKLVNLGPRVLKSDTAGLFVLAILNYELTN